MSHFFEKKDRWGNGLALWVVAGMVFVLPLAVWSLTTIRMENEVHTWVPHDNSDKLLYDWFVTHFPADDMILVTWEGSSLDDARTARLAQKVEGTMDADGHRRGGSKYIDRIRTPHDLIAMMKKNLVAADEAQKRLDGILVGAGPLRLQLTETGKPRKERVMELLRKQARETLGLAIQVQDAEAVALAAATAAVEAASLEPDPVVKPEAAQVAATDGAVEDANAPPADEPVEIPPHDLLVTWPGMHWDEAGIAEFRDMALTLRLPGANVATGQPGGSRKALIENCFQVVGSPIALAVYLSEAGKADRQEAFRALITAARDVGIPYEKIHMGGSAVAGAALNQEVLKSVWNASVPSYQVHKRSIVLFSGLVAGILALWLLGSFRLAGLVLGVSYYTMLVSTALVPMTGGSMNMVLVVMPTLLLVTTLSVGIHLANYWQHAAAVNIKTAVVESVKTAYVPCMWVGLTSAIGQISLVTSSLAPVRDFGIYSAIGTLISLAVTLYGLPALLQIWPGKAPKPEDLDNPFWHALAAWIAPRWKSVTAISLIGSCVCMLGLREFRTETKVIRYFAENTRTVQDYQYLEDNLAGIIPVDVIVRFDREAQQQLKFLERRDLVQKIETELEKLPYISGSLSLSDFLPTETAPGATASAREKLKYAAASRTIETRVKAGDQPGAKTLLAVAGAATKFNAPGDELWRVTAQVAIMSQLNYSDLRLQLDEICSNVLRGTSGNSGEKLPATRDRRAYHPGASHFVTGIIPLFLATQQELLESLIWSFLGAFGSIALVVMFVLRHPVAGILAMIPNVLPIGAVFGIVSWSGMRVDIGSTVTASIALGITIDGTLHLITWFRLGIQQGKNRAEAVALALGHCGPAMWQTTLVVSIGLLMLYPSDLILISRFGWLMAALLAAASVTDLFLTPALLAGPLGLIIQRCTSVTADEDTTESGISLVEAVKPVVSAIPGKPHLDKKTVRIRRAD